MRFLITQFLVILTIVKLNWAQDLSQYLVGYWPINNDLHDQIACQDLAQPQANFSTDKYGNANGSVSVNGLNTRFNLPVWFYLPVPFTITLWFYPRSFISYGRVFDFKDTTGLDIYLSYDYNTGNGQTTFQITYPNGQSFTARNLYVSLNTWTHLSFVQSENMTTVYVNGTQSTQTVLNQTVPSLNLTYGFFGGAQNGYNANGEFDEIKIFNITLNQTQIAQDMMRNHSYTISNPCNSPNISYAGLASSLAFYWPIENNSYDLISCNNLQSAMPEYVSDRFGNPTGAFNVSDVNTAFNIPSGFSLTSSFTITLWFYAYSMSYWDRIFDFGFSSTQDFYLCSSGNTLGQPVFGANYPGINSQSHTLSISSNSWNHFATSVNGLDSYFYINGVLNAYLRLNQTLSLNNIPYGFFGRAVTSGSYATGYFDEIKIFNKTLSQFEVIKDKEMQGSYSINSQCSNSPFTYNNLTSSLLFYWPINNDASDLVSCVNLATPSTPFVSDRFGNANSALRVNNLQSQFNIPAGFSLPSQFTITLWFIPYNFTSWDRIFDFGFNNGLDFYMASTSYTLAQPAFQALWSNGMTRISNLVLTANTWNHMAVVVDGLNLYLYINGTVNVNGVLNQSLSTSNIPFGYFGRAIPYGYSANADFDEIKIFGRALSQYEIIKDKDMSTSYSINTTCQSENLNYSTIYPDLTEYWPVDGSKQELVSGKNLTSPGFLLVPDMCGNAMSAFRVTNSSNYVQVTQSMTLSNKFTITLWYKPLKMIAGSIIFIMSDGSSDIYLEQSSSSTLALSTIVVTQGVIHSSGSSYLINNTWHHIAVSVNGTTAYFYLNGTLNTYITFPQSISTSMTTNLFGSLSSSSLIGQGDFDEIKIFKVSLNQHQVIQDMIGYSDCSPFFSEIQVNITNQFSDPKYPFQLNRSSVNTFSANVSFATYYAYSLSHEWFIYSIDPTTFETISLITLSFNPTMTTTSFTLPSNTLDYGLYKLILNTNATLIKNSQTYTVSGSNFTFVQIIPTGIVVQAIANGVTSVTLGCLQGYTLNPVAYSNDIDGILSMSTLNFKFYCQQVNSSMVGVNYLLNGNYVDLATGVGNNSCIANQSMIYFNSSGNVLTIKPGGFGSSWGKINQFIVTTQAYNRTFYQILEFNINPEVSSYPLPSINCLVSGFCIPFGSVYLFSVSNQMVFEGSYSDGNEFIDSIEYSWTVYKNLGNTTSYSWSLLDSTEQVHLQITTPTELVIDNGLFSGTSVAEWMIQFEMVTYSKLLSVLNGANFTSQMIILANKQPSGGDCWVDLDNGYALDTWFNIYCENWTDADGIVVKYEFFATFLNNVSTVNLGYNQTSMFYTQLPSGDSADSNNLYVFVNIFDNVGSITTYYISKPVQITMQLATLQASTTALLSMSPSSPLVQSIQDPDISVASSAIIAYAASLNQITTGNSTDKTELNQAQQINQLFVSSISNYDLQDLSSMKAASSTLSVVSANPVLISSSTATQISDLCSTMTQNLINSSSQYSLTYVYQAASYILDASANVVQSINLQSDSDSSDLLQKVVTAQKDMIDTITNITVAQLAINSSTNVQKNNINLTIAKTMMNHVDTNFETNNCLLKYSNPCSIVGLPEGNCSNKTVIQQVFSRTMSLALSSNTNTEGSSAISISFYQEDMQEYNVNDSPEGFNIWISMSQSQTPIEVDLNNLTLSSSNQLQTYYSTIKSLSQAAVVELIPSDTSLSYLLCVSYDNTPVVSSSNQVYDDCIIFCPRDLVTESGVHFYKLFLNVSTNGQSFQSLGYGFRELTSSEDASLCASSSSQLITEPPLLPDSYNFSQVLSHAVSRFVYSLSCYYLDENTMTYSISGVYVLPDSTTTSIHCWSSHLTEFAGGLVVMPDSIDFSKAFANASFTQNLTIYLTVIIISCLYLIMLIVCRYFDWLDEKKRCIYLLKDNNSWDNYFYELIVFTGGRQEAGTESNVHFVISGSDIDTEVRNLDPCKRAKDRILQRGSVDSFIMSTPGPLGNLLYLRIWHDNSGKRGRASWFLKYVIVHDLQTREKYYFICNEWLACDKGDGRLERVLPLATDKQKTDLKYLIEKQTKEKMSDGHLWFSILARPTISSFTRTDRLTCAFVLLCLTMLMNILYYGMASSSSGSAIVLGPFSLSSTQIAIGVMTNLIIFPPSFILLQIFRKSRRRTTRSVILSQQISRHAKNKKQVEVENKQEIKDKKQKKYGKPFTLPWWFKIIGYLLSFCIVTVCIFFIIIKGITFGDDLCRKWLTSFIISVLTSIFLTQPIQVILLSIFFILLFRKSNDENDLEPDPLDDGNSLNKFYSFKSAKKTNQKQPLRVTKDTYTHLQVLREKLEREKQVWAKMREIILYAIFLTFTFYVAYSKTSPVSYNYQNQLQNLLLPNITMVQRVDQMWNWLKNDFVPAAMGSEWYNDHTTNTTIYLNDHVSYLVGTVLLRQSRVKVSSCSNAISGLSTCELDYSIYNYDSQDYGVGWSQSAVSSSSAIKDAFMYTNALSIKSQPYSGEYTSYLGGGYVFELDIKSNNSSQVLNYLAQLERNDWIDQQSRALFIEFTVFNVNLNLFSYCVILFELLPTGTVVPSSEFNPMSLYTDEAVIIVAFDIVYMFMIVFLMLYQIKLISKLRINYLKHFWPYLDWMLIAFSWTSFGLYMNRLNEKANLTRQISNNDSQIINFQTICYWNQLMLFFLGLCCFLASVRLIKVMSFSRNIKILILTLRRVLKEMLCFSIIYCILLFAYINLMYLISYDKNQQFESFATSLVTGFLILIGKFNVDSFVQDTGVLGVLIYVSFAVVMIIILLNMFITFLTAKFSDIRKEFIQAENSFMTQYFKETIWPRAKENYQVVLNKLKRKNNEQDVMPDRAVNYIESAQNFDAKTSNLLKHVDRAYNTDLT